MTVVLQELKFHFPIPILYIDQWFSNGSSGIRIGIAVNPIPTPFPIIPISILIPIN